MASVGLAEAGLEQFLGFQGYLTFGEVSLECANRSEILKSPVITGVGARWQNPPLRPFSSTAATPPFPDDKTSQILAPQTQSVPDSQAFHNFLVFAHEAALSQTPVLNSPTAARMRSINSASPRAITDRQARC